VFQSSTMAVADGARPACGGECYGSGSSKKVAGESLLTTWQRVGDGLADGDVGTVEIDAGGRCRRWRRV
jgi:hypothetical protein